MSYAFGRVTGLISAVNKNSKILVAGASGMVGSAIVRLLLSKGHRNIIGSYRTAEPDSSIYQLKEKPPSANSLQLTRLDLTDQAAVYRYFDQEKPEFVFLAAAKVGGIHANDTCPAQFIHSNLAVQTHTIHAAYQSGVKRLLFLGSSCIYPKHAPQPMQEDCLLTGLLEPTNEPYAIAKIAGIKMCEAYNRQYGTRFMAVMPTNLYGPNDNFDPQNSHVLPALIRKFHEAQQAGKEEVIIWGSGKPQREFLHVDDLADACVFVMNLDEKTAVDQFFNYPKPCFVNVGTGSDCSILDLAKKIQQVTGFKGRLAVDPSKPDGTPRKLLDVSRLKDLGWSPKIHLTTGIERTYAWYRRQLNRG